MDLVMYMFLSLILTSRIVTSGPNVSCKNKCGQTSNGELCYCVKQCVVYKNCCEDFQTECPDVYRQGMSEFKDLVPLEVTCTTYDVLMISSCQTSVIGDSGYNDVDGSTTGSGHLGSNDGEGSTTGYEHLGSNHVDGSTAGYGNVADIRQESDIFGDRTTALMHAGDNTRGDTKFSHHFSQKEKESIKSEHMESNDTFKQFPDNVLNQTAPITKETTKESVSTYYAYFLAAMINPPVQDIETQLVYKNFSIYKCNVKHSSNYLSWQAFVPDKGKENKDDVRIQYKPPSAVNKFFKNCIHSAISSCKSGQFWDKTTELKCKSFISYVRFKTDLIYRNQYCLYCHHGKESRYENVLRVTVLQHGLALTFLLKDRHTLKISSNSNIRPWHEMTCSINDEMSSNLNALFDDDKRCKAEGCIRGTFLHANGKCHIPYYLRFAVYLDDKNFVSPNNFFSLILAFVLIKHAHLDVSAIQENRTLFNPKQNKTFYSGIVVVHLPDNYHTYNLAIRYPRELTTVAVAFSQCWRKYSRTLARRTRVSVAEAFKMENIVWITLPDDNSTQQSPDDRVSFCIAMSSADPIDFYCTVNTTHQPNTTILQNLLLNNCLTSNSQHTFHKVSQFVYILFIFVCTLVLYVFK